MDSSMRQGQNQYMNKSYIKFKYNSVHPSRRNANAETNMTLNLTQNSRFSGLPSTQTPLRNHMKKPRTFGRRNNTIHEHHSQFAYLKTLQT